LKNSSSWPRSGSHVASRLGTALVRVLISLLLLGGCVSPPLAAGSTAGVASATSTPPEATSTPFATPAPTATVRPTRTATPTPTCTATPLSPLVAIDPGHGGRDFGGRHFDASGHMDVSEKEIVLAIALKVADRLKAAGYRVLLTRDGDYRVNSQEKLDLNEDGEVDSADELLARTRLINAVGADLLLSIHQNAYYGPDAQEVGGTQTLYCRDRPFGDESYRFAYLVQEKVVQALRKVGYETRDRGVLSDTDLNVPGAKGTHLILLGPKSDRISIPSQMPGALSETLFLTNDAEAALLQRTDVQDALARAYAEAIEAYFDEQRAAGMMAR